MEKRLYGLRESNMKELSVAIIGAGELALEYAKKAKEMGVVTHCFAWEQGAIARDAADHFYPISIFEKEKILAICKEQHIHGVLPTTELTIAIAAYLQEQLSAAVNLNYQNALCVTKKNWVRTKTASAKYLNHPAFLFLHSPEERFLWDRFPAIVKPASEGGKRGVSVARSSEELNNAVRYAFAHDKFGNGVLIESYLSKGQEYSVEAMSYRGRHAIIQITEKTSSGPPHCVELGHHQPAELTREEQRDVALAITELLTAVSFENGPTHTEIKLVNGKIYLIELNARPGGDFISTILTQLSTGYDYLRESIAVALSLEPAPSPTENVNCAGVYFLTKQTEYLKPFFDRCDKQKWLYQKQMRSEPLSELKNNDDLQQNYIIYCSDHKIQLQDCEDT